MPVYESTATVKTFTKLETHLVNNDCVLYRLTTACQNVSMTGMPVMAVNTAPAVSEGSVTASELRKWVSNKPFKTGILVGPKKDRRRIAFGWFSDEWQSKLVRGTLDRDEVYSHGRSDIYTAVVDEGLSPDNLLARDHYDSAIYTRYLTRQTQSLVFDYINAGVNAGKYRDLEAVAAKLLERDDIRIYVEESYSSRTSDAKDPAKAVDTIPGYNASRENGGRAVQFVWSPSQADYDRVSAEVSEKTPSDDYSRNDMIAAVLKMDIFGIAQFRYTAAERKLIEDSCQHLDEDY